MKLTVLNVLNEYERIWKPGRPKAKISESTLLDLCEFGYNWKETGQMLLVSQWTVYHWEKEQNIEHVTGYSNISNDELDKKINEFKQSTGLLAGHSMAVGFLK